MVTSSWQPVLALLGVVLGGIGLLYLAGTVLAVVATPYEAETFTGGLPPQEHAFCRYHVRWYPVSLVFLAFDMEMLFMYPWVRVVAEVGPSAVAEMFLFLGVLTAAVVYAWREGALRWT